MNALIDLFCFCSDYRSCIYIWTNNTDDVIKLEEIDFEIISGSSCYGDNLTIFYTTFDEAGKFCVILICCIVFAC